MASSALEKSGEVPLSALISEVHAALRVPLDEWLQRPLPTLRVYNGSNCGDDEDEATTADDDAGRDPEEQARLEEERYGPLPTVADDVGRRRDPLVTSLMKLGGPFLRRLQSLRNAFSEHVKG